MMMMGQIEAAKAHDEKSRELNGMDAIVNFILDEKENHNVRRTESSTSTHDSSSVLVI